MLLLSLSNLEGQVMFSSEPGFNSKQFNVKKNVHIISTGDIFGKRVFVKNKGQFDNILPNKKSVEYAYTNGDEQVYFNKSGVTYFLQKHFPLTEEQMEKMEDGKKLIQKPTLKAFVNVIWENSNQNIEILVSDQQPFYHSFGEEQYKSECYKKITYKNVYNHIDIEYVFTNEKDIGIEYNVILRPGANVNDIKIKYSGDVKKVYLKRGNVVIKTSVSNITEYAPISFQNKGKIESNFTVENNIISFNLPNGYDISEDLIIDPWVVNLALPTTNIGFDVDFDNAGNYYVYGGSGPYLVSKYTAAGALVWTFNGVVTTPAWNSSGTNTACPGNFVVDKIAGKTYIGQGVEQTLGCRVIRINALGVYDNFISTANINFTELSDMSFYGGCTGVAKVIIIGGGPGAPSKTGGILNVTTGAITYNSVVGSVLARQDAMSHALDPNGNSYITTASPSEPLLNHKILKINSTFNGNIWNQPRLATLYEGSNKSYPGFGGGGGQAIGFNALAASTNYLYYYDGLNLAAYNTTTGTFISSITTGLTIRSQGGVAVDDCNNVYVGGVDAIKCYTFNGTNFITSGDIQLGLTTINKNVTDIKFNSTTNELYVCGTGFGGIVSATYSASCPTVINSLIEPTFAALGPFCVGATPGVLPSTSSNGIIGTWSPATISTTSAGTFVYTFTPNAGQCADTASMNVTISSSFTPTFTALGPYCVGATPGTLPIISTNSITGTWNPASISTSTVGATIYTFTPNAGQCATTTTMSISITNSITPTFTAMGPYCLGSTPTGVLPTTSNNSITGTWSPAIISTSTPGTSVYTFTPNAGQCATPSNMSITVSSTITPTFNPLGQFCVGATPGILPATSTNSITGNWSPASISTTTIGTFVYTFTSDTGQCANNTSMNITINALPTIIASASPSSICNGQASTLTATGADTYVWMPGNLIGAMVSVSPTTTTTTYLVVGTSLGGCQDSTTVTVLLSNVAPLLFNTLPDEGCVPLFVHFNFQNDGTIDSNSIHWDFGDPTTTSDVSNLNSPTYTYTNDGNFIVTLSGITITGCNAIGYDTITVYPDPIADFNAIPWVADIYSPVIHFYDASVNANEWLWYFGDTGNNTSTLQFPIYTYNTSGDFPVMLIVRNGECTDTIIKHIIIGDGFTYYIPNSFSPSEDNKNENFNGKGTGFKTDDFELLIFDRWGELIFRTTDSEMGWNGYYNGKFCMEGVYVYKFKVVEMNNKVHFFVGSVTLLK